MSSSIHIERFDVHYTLPRGVEVAPLKERLDRVVSDVLPRMWDSRIMGGGPLDPIYFIDRIDLDVVFAAAAMDDGAIAGTFADTLGSEISAAIARGDAGVIAFANRAEYLASFIQDLLRGSAWDRWYYRDFEPLRSQANATIIRELLVEDGDVGREVLTELAGRGDLELLLSTLGHDDTGTVVARCILPQAPRLHLPGRHAVWIVALREHIRGSRFRRTGTARDLVLLYTGLLRIRPDLGPDVHMARFIDEMLALAGMLAGRADGARILRSLRTEGLAGLATALGVKEGAASSGASDAEMRARDLTALLRMLDRDGDGAAELLGELSGVEATDTTEAFFTSRFGSIFLLAPTIAELRLHALFAARNVDLRDTGTLVGLLLLQCLGPEQAPAALRDRGLHFLAGSRLTDEDVARLADPERTARIVEAVNAVYAETKANTPAYRLGRHEDDGSADYLFSAEITTPAVPGALAEALWPLSSLVLREFASRLGAFSESTPSYLRTNFLTSAANVEISREAVIVCLIGSPLGMVLRMAGFERIATVMDWAGGRTLSFAFDE